MSFLLLLFKFYYWRFEVRGAMCLLLKMNTVIKEKFVNLFLANSLVIFKVVFIKWQNTRIFSIPWPKKFYHFRRKHVFYAQSTKGIFLEIRFELLLWLRKCKHIYTRDFCSPLNSIIWIIFNPVYLAIT